MLQTSMCCNNCMQKSLKFKEVGNNTSQCLLFLLPRSCYSQDLVTSAFGQCTRFFVHAQHSHEISSNPFKQLKDVGASCSVDTDLGQVAKARCCQTAWHLLCVSACSNESSSQSGTVAPAGCCQGWLLSVPHTVGTESVGINKRHGIGWLILYSFMGRQLLLVWVSTAHI